MKQLERLMAYIVSTADQSLRGYVRTTDEWEVYVDSDHAGDRALGTRSHTGIIIFLNGAPIYWQSKKQVSTALSSAEAEIYALAEAAKQARLAQWRAEELGIGTKWPIDIQVDNKAGISFQKATNPNTKLLGCFDLRDSWVSELRDKAQIKAVKVHTDNNCADLLTKCHSKQRFQHLVQLIRSKGMIQQAP